MFRKISIYLLLPLTFALILSACKGSKELTSTHWDTENSIPDQSDIKAADLILGKWLLVYTSDTSDFIYEEMVNNATVEFFEDGMIHQRYKTNYDINKYYLQDENTLIWADFLPLDIVKIKSISKKEMSLIVNIYGEEVETRLEKIKD